MPSAFPPVAFDTPAWLLTLPMLLAAAWWLQRGAALPDSRQRLLAAVLRAAIFTLVTLALAGTQCVQTSRRQTVVYVVDGSLSVGGTAQKDARTAVAATWQGLRGGDRIGIVSAGGDAALTLAPGEKSVVSVPQTLPAAPEPTATNLARGVSRALAAIPDDSAGRIVLVSDGNENAGQVLEAAQGAKDAGVPVDVIALTNGKNDAPETIVERLDVPGAARRGEPFRLSVAATSRTGGKGALAVYKNGTLWHTEAVTLTAGKNLLQVSDRGGDPGFYTYEARLTMEPGADTILENNRAVSFVRVLGQPRVLVVHDPVGGDPSDAASLVAALRTQKLFVSEGGPESIPGTGPAPLLAYDGVILVNTPAEAFNKEQMGALQSSVRDLGLGLVMVGGDYSYAAGAWQGTPVEAALPVEMESKKQKRFPAVALALAVDISGSMSDPPRGGGDMSKIELAQESAHRAVDTLTHQDSAGVIAVDTEANTIVALTSAEKKGAIHQGISELGGGGGTDMSAGVEAGYDMLKDAKSPVKHVILLTDGETPPHDYAQTIADYKKKNITFTIIFLDDGQSAESIEPLKRVAVQTGGRYYFVTDANQLPKIYTREIRTIRKPPIIEEPFEPALGPQGAGHPLLDSVAWQQSPPLLGYDVAFPKATAETLLVSHRGDPLLCTWQYGLGRSLAWTSDAAPRWGANWLGWDGYPAFWAQAVRYVLKPPAASGTESAVSVRVARENGKARLVADAIDPQTGAFLNNLSPVARITRPDGSGETVPLVQTAPGRYEADGIDAARVGSYTASVQYTGADGTPRAVPVGFAVAYSPEFAALSPDTALLARVADLSGGRVLTSGRDVLAVRGARRVPTPLVIPLLTLALLLLPLDVANRRLSLWRARETAQAAVKQVQENVAAQGAARVEAVRVAEVQAVKRVETAVKGRKERFKALEGDED